MKASRVNVLTYLVALVQLTQGGLPVFEQRYGNYNNQGNQHHNAFFRDSTINKEFQDSLSTQNNNEPQFPSYQHYGHHAINDNDRNVNHGNNEVQQHLEKNHEFSPGRNDQKKFSINHAELKQNPAKRSLSNLQYNEQQSIMEDQHPEKLFSTSQQYSEEQLLSNEKQTQELEQNQSGNQFKKESNGQQNNQQISEIINDQQEEHHFTQQTGDIYAYNQKEDKKTISGQKFEAKQNEQKFNQQSSELPYKVSQESTEKEFSTNEAYNDDEQMLKERDHEIKINENYPIRELLEKPVLFRESGVNQDEKQRYEEETLQSEKLKSNTQANEPSMVNKQINKLNNINKPKDIEHNIQENESKEIIDLPDDIDDISDDDIDLIQEEEFWRNEEIYADEHKQPEQEGLTSEESQVTSEFKQEQSTSQSDQEELTQKIPQKTSTQVSAEKQTTSVLDQEQAAAVSEQVPELWKLGKQMDTPPSSIRQTDGDGDSYQRGRYDPTKTSSRQEIQQALESDITFKTLVMPDGSKYGRCFCSCDLNSKPVFISMDQLDALP